MMQPDSAPEQSRHDTSTTSLVGAEAVGERIGNVRWRLRPGVRPAVLGAVMQRPDAFLSDPSCRLEAGDPRLVTLGVVAGSGREPPLLLRRLDYGRLLHRLRDAGRRVTRAERAFNHGLALERAGIPTPRVFAVGVERRLWWPVRAYLVSEYVPRARTLQALLDTQHGLTPDQAGQLVGLVARLHAAGFSNRDMKATNLLYKERGEPCFIDLDGVRRHRAVSLGRVAKDLERLARNFPTQELSLRARWLLRRYCRQRGLRQAFRRIHAQVLKRRGAKLRSRGLLWRLRVFAAPTWVGLDPLSPC